MLVVLFCWLVALLSIPPTSLALSLAQLVQVVQLVELLISPNLYLV
jgi:hypothetical protein